MAEGWKGANESEIMTDSTKCDKCGASQKQLKSFHSIKGHITVCYSCSRKLSSVWYGCGCGGQNEN